MRCLLLMLFGFFQFSLAAQVQVESGLALEQYVNEILLGNNGEASNITYTGGANQLGYLTEGEEVFSFNSGLVLSCDLAENIACPGQASFCEDCLGSAFDDPDLLAVANSVPELIGQTFTVSSVNDGCVLEFDFIASGTAITLEFVFGSDEYETWINTQYNDVFAFFLSGPGIEGPYASPEGFPNGALNIAGIPDTDPLIPVTISSVNSSLNSDFFISNQPNIGACINGYTVPMLAQHPLVCGETYHLKLAIADGSDPALESMVIIKDGTFSNAVQPDFDFNLTGLFDNNLYEDCGLATLTIERPMDTSYDEVVHLNFFGEATNGEDYGIPQPDGSLLPLPDSVTFSQGQMSVSFDFAAELDEVEEGIENVMFQFEYPSFCESGIALDSLSFNLAENPPALEATGFEVSICPGETIAVGPVVSGGYGQYTLDWGCPEGNGEDSILIAPTQDWSCVVTVTDTCGLAANPLYVDLIVNVLDYPELTVSIDQANPIALDCNGSATLSATASGGDENYFFYWTDGAGNLLSFNSAELTITQGQNIDQVIVTVSDGCGQATDTILVETFAPFTVNVQENWEVECGAEVAVEAEATGIDLVFIWRTENGIIVDNDETLNWVVTDDAIFILEVQDACGQVQFTTVSLNTDCAPPEEELCAYVDLGNGALIPDDQTSCFSWETEVSLGNPSAIVSEASDVSFFVNMEHSFMGDLIITYTCPNGQSLAVVQQGGSATQIGIPDQLDGTGPGVGWDYFWSPIATSGTWADNAGGTLPAGMYESAQPFSLLEGCPVDGVWQIEICDLWGADDGYLFAWGIDFGNCAGESGCTNPEACNYDPTAGFDDDSCTLPGCTDQGACNYDPLAGCDDQSCLPYDTVAGCMDQNACNFNPDVLCADQSCVYPLFGNDCNLGAIACGGSTVWDAANQMCVCEDGSNNANCPSDLNGNGLVEVTDLLIVLGDFGLECEE
jgi:subtilisin-like proprotein convertase family protein